MTTHLPVQMVPLDVELSQVLHVPQVARNLARELVAAQVQPLKSLTVHHHSFGDTSVQVIVVQVQVFQLQKAIPR